VRANVKKNNLRTNTNILPEELQLILMTNQAHKTIAQRYNAVLNTLRKKGVSFEGIQRHLEKQMKRSGIS